MRVSSALLTKTNPEFHEFLENKQIRKRINFSNFFCMLLNPNIFFQSEL